MPQQGDWLSARDRLLATKGGATTLAPTPPKTLPDRLLQFLTGITNPRTQTTDDIEQGVGPADVAMAALGVGGVGKGMSKMADQAMDASLPSIMGKARQTLQPRSLGPIIDDDVVGLMAARQSEAISPDAYRQTIIKRLMPKVLKRYTEPQTRREMIKNLLGAPGRYREYKGLNDLPDLENTFADTDIYGVSETDAPGYANDVINTIFAKHPDAMAVLGNTKQGLRNGNEEWAIAEMVLGNPQADHFEQAAHLGYPLERAAKDLAKPGNLMHTALGVDRLAKAKGPVLDSSNILMRVLRGGK